MEQTNAGFGGSVVPEISKDLSAEHGAEQKPPEVFPFDLSKLSVEQIQKLQDALATTPRAVKNKNLRPKVKIRKVDGKIVVSFKNAFLGLVHDNDLNRDVERHIIPVKFLGSTEYVNITYRKFVQGEQVPCEVVSTRQQTEEIVEGETVSRETGQLVEMVKKFVKVWFTVKLPEGSGQETVEIEGKVANG